MDEKQIERLWPNRAHESNWLKAACCALGLHRWHRLKFTDGTHADCCRWCPKVIIRDQLK